MLNRTPMSAARVLRTGIPTLMCTSIRSCQPVLAVGNGPRACDIMYSRSQLWVPGTVEFDFNPEAI